ncbi:hypothetical protein RI129_013027 [Pyrocoelia pectoralis]|uniref:Acyltransferase 3 domain-containing protein n=1 Tax=Pyrocoelia pectoralis TaxID=417401 RepID=A0AAN7ZCQ3_9COLE
MYRDENETKLSGKYCLGYLYVNNTRVSTITRPFDKIHRMLFPTCIPSGCTALDVQHLSTGLGFNLSIIENWCQTAGSQSEFDHLSITVVTLFGCVALFMVLSTIYDLYNRFIRNCKSLKRYDIFLLKSSITGVPNWILSSFSVYKNGKELFAIKHNSEEIECLYGLRVLAMVVIVIGHTFLVVHFQPIRNEYFVDHWVHQVQNMWIVKGDYAVDTFFVLSGILVSYSFMLKIVKNHKFNIIQHYLNRYLRLTPSLAAFILFVVGLLKFLGSGPMWPSFEGYTIEPCKEHWWYNLLYITNYVNEKVHLGITINFTITFVF